MFFITTNHPYYINDFWYEPEATFSRLLSKSIYETDWDRIIGRRNIYYTSTNHTAEDQIVIIFFRNPFMKFNPFGDNTDLFNLMFNI